MDERWTKDSEQLNKPTNIKGDTISCESDNKSQVRHCRFNPSSGFHAAVGGSEARATILTWGNSAESTFRRKMSLNECSRVAGNHDASPCEVLLLLLLLLFEAIEHICLANRKKKKIRGATARNEVGSSTVSQLATDVARGATYVPAVAAAVTPASSLRFRRSSCRLSKVPVIRGPG